MSKHTTVLCDGWLDFKCKLSDLSNGQPFLRGAYLFRGHGSSRWPLMSSFDRWFKGKPRAKKMKAFERLVNLFQKEAEGTDVSGGLWSDEVAKLALAQHHGLPTRLLDWTESPYIAAFFAFAGIALVPEAEEHVAIWSLNTKHEIWSKDFGAEILDVPSYGNERLRSQLGKFTLLRAPFDTLEEYVSHFDSADDALSQYLLPSSEASIALADLDLMGINYSKIFPGLEGCARAARLRLHFEQP